MIPSSHNTGSNFTPVPPKKGITDLTISIPSSQTRDIETQPSRWSTFEFKVYGLIFLLVVPVMVYIPISLSSVDHPNFPHYAERLSPGWMFGRLVDNSDPQYHTFRSNLPALLILASSHTLLSLLSSYISTGHEGKIRSMTVLSSLIIFILHGFSSLKILFILALNYHLAILPKSGLIGKMWPGLVMVGNMGLLFLNHKYEGYRFGSIFHGLDYLDEVDGLLPRWHVGFNITMLRIISFALDYHWKQSSAEVPTEYRKRVNTSLPEEDYSFINFVAYCLYPPLYIAGPIITFNGFIWQLRKPVTITLREKLSYAFRFATSLLTMEAVLHTMYVVAIKDSSAWDGDTPAQLSMIGFWNLVVVWLKLLIPWRYFRLWALLDGIDPPENMIRCVANNYSTLGFWRSWHRSYNLWVVRYIYIPSGGGKNVIMSTVLVFTFVALWHDLSMKLLAWGWLVSLFMLPEILARTAFSAKKYGQYPWYRHISALGGVLNILMMMTANLVGFVLGLEGIKHLALQLISTWSGISYLVFASGCLFAAVQVMFEYREEERRKGIDRRC